MHSEEMVTGGAGLRLFGFFLAAALLCTVSGVANANYWFQFGARGGQGGESNSGASLAIETVTPQNVSTGAPAFWVGETLSNGAFIQAGYIVVNQTASYPVSCDISQGCTKYAEINASQAEWFYEYFPQGYTGSSFLGEIGPAGSAGGNGTFNTYGFYAKGTVWNVIFDGNVVGSVDLGSGTSGVHSPVAFAEVANATNEDATVGEVIMSNLSTYSGGVFSPVNQAFSYIGFGAGSTQGVPVPYGVQELGNRVNYFGVGSGLARPANGTQLWGAGYTLDIESQYGGIANRTQNIAYSKITIDAPRVAGISNGSRAVFDGWEGSGVGSYTGAQNSTTIVVESNLTEKALWQIQYLLDVSSEYGSSSGTGWYNAGAQADYGLNSTTDYINGSERELFSGWSNGKKALSGSTAVEGPARLTASWQPQYLLSLTTEYGNASGGGWVDANSPVRILVSPTYMQLNGTARLAFYRWSNGVGNSSFSENVSGPARLNAQFAKQYLYRIQALDAYGNRIGAAGFYANGREVNSTDYFFAGQGYNLTQAYYKGVWMPVSSRVIVNSSSVSDITLPVYNIEVYTKDIFGMPVNASVYLRFANGTDAQFSTGGSGSLLIEDAPYGGATGSASFFILRQQISTESGVPLTLIFITQLDLLVLALIVAGAALIYFLASRALRHGKDSEDVAFGKGVGGGS